MSAFKPFFIRVCTQCKDPQPLKCAKCSHHPTRKPKIIEVYAPPMTLKICECKLSVQFMCQRDGCTNKVWRSLKCNSRAGKVYAKKMFCSRACVMTQLGKDLTTSVEVACDWCGKMVMRTPCRLKRENTFCCKSHIYLWREKKRHDAKEADKKYDAEVKVKQKESLDIGTLWCEKCNDVTKHETPSLHGRGKGHYKVPPAKCMKCGNSRDQNLGTTGLNRDALAIKMALKEIGVAGMERA